MTVRNGQEALTAFEQSEPGKFAAVLLDIQMPVMDGYETAEKIRSSSHPDAKNIPIIAMTANAFSGREGTMPENRDEWLCHQAAESAGFI